MPDDPTPEKLPRPKVHLLNVAHTKAFILAYCGKNRPKFQRVSLDFLLRMEARLKAIIQDEVHRHPSKGVTLQ